MLAPKTPAPAALMLSIPISSYHSATTIVQLPLAFVRSGVINLGYGQDRLVGEVGYGWSRTTKSSTHVYYLTFYPMVVYPSDGSNSWYGFPLRWL